MTCNVLRLSIAVNNVSSFFLPVAFAAVTTTGTTSLLASALG